MVVVLGLEGDTLRQFSTELDTAFSSSIWWRMDTKGVQFPSKNDPPKDRDEPGGGPKVLAGDYWVKVKYMDWTDSVKVTVMDDPRLNISKADREAQNAAIRDINTLVERLTNAYNRLKEAEKTVSLVESQFVNVPDSLKKDVLKLGAAIKDTISNLKEQFFQHKEEKGIKRGEDNMNSKIWRALGYIRRNDGEPNSTAEIAANTAKQDAEALISKINELFETQWTEFRSTAETIQYTLFKDFERL